jgi:hypothetical protein
VHIQKRKSFRIKTTRVGTSVVKNAFIDLRLTSLSLFVEKDCPAESQ